MSTELKYKNPSVLLRSMVGNFATTFQGYMKNSAQLLQDIQKQADKEGIPKEQLRKIIEEQLTRQGLAKSSIRRILPADLKNQNMTRKQIPKKEPLVKEWKLEFNVREIASQTANMLAKGITKGYFTHDERRITGVEIY
jgi:hypothetical protein